MKGYAFHPEAGRGLNAIREFIAEDNELAADPVIGKSRIFHGRRSPQVIAAALRSVNLGTAVLRQLG